MKDWLCTDTLLAHFDPSLDIGISCDASDCGIGAVLFHRFPDGSERPIANVSKTLSPAQRRYSQIHKEALAIIFALTKFHQFLYARKFILVTDYKPLLNIFSPHKAHQLWQQIVWPGGLLLSANMTIALNTDNRLNMAMRMPSVAYLQDQTQHLTKEKEMQTWTQFAQSESLALKSDQLIQEWWPEKAPKMQLSRRS